MWPFGLSKKERDALEERIRENKKQIDVLVICHRELRGMFYEFSDQVSAEARELSVDEVF